ncbi:molybdopterin-dependent oxidoreductase [Rhodococcus pseudokoreensis]|uniref:Molybdopterin-dependent oxidoreductase n=2 Tax=Rhodococcus pseudokoreensis TaxID=2811421 RepID=A0A974W3R1_9NOCA|nr:molybdopterin-dependent oxidoreductase [Rhodococcus pseudokoreensis]
MCGLLVTIEDGAAVGSMGDRDHAATEGYCCRKGRNIHKLHTKPDRFLQSQRGNRRGGFVPIETATAIDEIGERLSEIREKHGPDSIGLFLGTQAYQATPTIPVVKAWLRAIGTRKYFRTVSIDQSAKVIATGRLGAWAAGNQRFDESDVWLFAGTNPIVSMQGGPASFPIHRGRRALREARDRGMYIIVADPRLTETAREADLHLPLRPGTDSLLAAAILHVILEERLHDGEFCRNHVTGLANLERALAHVTPGSVAADTGIAADDIVLAARRFATATRGMTTTGTGPDMSVWSNLNEHLWQLLNVICGRFPRAGEFHAEYGVLTSSQSHRAEVAPPGRPWESGYRSRLGYGLLAGDLPTASLPREITEPGPDRIRALVVVGGNPLAALPGPASVRTAFQQLDLLVALEPFPTETAELADYVLAPRMILERPDVTKMFDQWYDKPFGQYTPAVLEGPEETVEDWQYLARIAGAMGLPLTIGSFEVSNSQGAVTTEQLLDHLSRKGQADLQELRRRPHGHVFDNAARPIIAPAGDSAGRFDLLPDDVAGELRAALRRERITLSTADRRPDEALLTVRRTQGVMNSLGRDVLTMTRTPYNPCHVNPTQLEAIEATAGDLLLLETQHGRVIAVAEADDTVQPGTVSLAHCFRGPRDDADPRHSGANPGALISLHEVTETINAMPRLSGVPVRLAKYRVD